MPFRQFVLKVASRCDLACDHCYVYEHADQSWRRRPKVIEPDTLTAAADRIAEHARAHRLPAVHVVLHGGEPLLAGHDLLEQAIVGLRGALEGVCGLDLRVHTNGVTLDDRFCRLFAAHGVRVGVSLDGDRPANDLHRRYADGRGSYDRVIRGIDLLRRTYPGIYAGLLCTIDVRNDPVAVYEALIALDPPVVDFLLPHATWDHPPPRPRSETEYADWLIAIFDRWAKDGRPVGVRMFDSIIRTGRGQGSLTEAFGLDECDLAVIETDGRYEQVDSLKTAYDGAPATGCDVFTHTLDQLAASPSMAGRRAGLEGLCETCQSCPVVTSCGGGLYAHRYRAGAGFLNPSVYCPDLLRLVTHIHEHDDRARGASPPPRGSAPVVSAAALPIPQDELDALGSGYGGGEVIARLESGQRFIRRMLVTGVGETGLPGVPGAWDLLLALDRDHRDALQRVLDHPYVRVWAERCRESGAHAAPEPGYLANIVLAAAVRAGVVARLTVPVTGGLLHLPTLGGLVTGRVAEARVETGPGGFAVTAGRRRWEVRLDDRAGGDWRPVRRLAAEGLSVVLEDTDPHRDCYETPVSPRLSRKRAEEWQEMFARAWDLILADHAAYAPALAAGLRVMTPLASAGPDADASATARYAGGAIGVALPGDPATLALLMMHEFQHVKLGAVMDLLGLYKLHLYHQSDTRLYEAPWRADRRPLEGLLQGTYAHVAVADFWRVRRHGGAEADTRAAEIRYRRWRSGTLAACGTLIDSGSLTPLGERFVGKIRATVESWSDD
ncbi:FxsB family cyclophane-forming radical SAM/SPASM peptide maturase [Sphaerisporangium sp. NPDC005288]|uniref:FxsB family cyclophane-forming radical SAM/SPASM peptide maturase n=1 Tax=Sphaerisporangium sp. NPDC005288 TaxID=3155114 RepID=UPI0033BEF002